MGLRVDLPLLYYRLAGRRPGAELLGMCAEFHSRRAPGYKYPDPSFGPFAISGQAGRGTRAAQALLPVPRCRLEGGATKATGAATNDVSRRPGLQERGGTRAEI